MLHIKHQNNIFKKEKHLIRRIIFLILCFTFATSFFIFIKIIFLSEKKIPSKKIATLITNLPKIDGQDIDESIRKLQKQSSWFTPSHGTPLFTSRNYYSKNNSLFDLMEGDTNLYNPIPNQWILEHNLDYSNSNLLSEDPSHDGFTNLEKWLGNDPYNNPGATSSDPNDPDSRPLLWTKLRCYHSDFKNISYHFYFLGVDADSSKDIFLLYADEPLPDFTQQGKYILTTRVRHYKFGEQIAGMPLQIFSFKESRSVSNDISYNTSTLTLMNIETKEKYDLIMKSRLNPNPTTIEILDTISLEYILESPPRKITLKCGETFALESLAPLTDPEHKEQEIYKLVQAGPYGVVLERNKSTYSIPILSSSPQNN